MQSVVHLPGSMESECCNACVDVECLVQVVDQRSMQLALNFCHESNNPYFRLCYNSLGAFGTVNHLHFQVQIVATPLLE